ncbi:major capsid protein [Acinetobacter johnsonii]|uniref:major capsid protein n=1 Tax=Acinetobacter johnsonii TaxID=40214 RepID=UPI00294B28BB|nr:major capsid protein [Acinetobacter johnsonii]
MENKNAIQLVRKPTTLSIRLKQASVLAAGTALALHASAASSIDATGLTGEIDGGKATIIALFGTALVILGIFAGWRYLKRGANSA